MQIRLPFLFAAFLLILTPVGLGQTRPSGPKDLEAEMPADAHRLKIGDAAPDFSLKGVDGKTYSLGEVNATELQSKLIDTLGAYYPPTGR
jgi:hypothetical protein